MTPYRNRKRHLIIILVLMLIPLGYIWNSDTVLFLGSFLSQSQRVEKSYRPPPCDCDNSNNIPCKINGICLHFNYDRKVFFSSRWKQWNGQQFDLDYAPEAILNIEEFISKYNSDFIRSNLTDIFILKGLECVGKPAGGTYYNSWIYISYDPNYPAQPVKAMMHAEFSSILMRKYSFPEQEWLLINDKEFTYEKNISEVLGKEETNRILPDSLEGGFITEYAKTTLENDFNMIVMMLFTQQVDLCALRRRYERINKKVELAIKFYESIGSEAKFLECKRLNPDKTK